MEQLYHLSTSRLTFLEGTFEMIVDRGVPDLIPIPSSAKAAAYKIETGSDLLAPNDKYLFGLGMTNGCGLVSPVASVSCLIFFY